MPYRPSYAGFELNLISPILAVLPASAMAAAIGSVLSLAVLVLSSPFTGGWPSLGTLFAAGLGTLFLLLLAVIIATGFCAFHILLIGVPLAWLLGRRLATPLGLAVAVAGAVAGALMAAALFDAWPFGTDVDWPFTAMVMAYALLAGLLYRKSVLGARLLSPFAEPEPTA